MMMMKKRILFIKTISQCKDSCFQTKIFDMESRDTFFFVWCIWSSIVVAVFTVIITSATATAIMLVIRMLYSLLMFLQPLIYQSICDVLLQYYMIRYLNPSWLKIRDVHLHHLISFITGDCDLLYSSWCIIIGLPSRINATPLFQLFRQIHLPFESHVTNISIIEFNSNTNKQS